MSRAIKVEDHIYYALDMIRTKGLTFSQVIEGMLTARLKLFELFNVIEGQLQYREHQRRQLDAMTEARAERAALDSRTL